jgi:hypothetical protein
LAGERDGVGSGNGQGNIVGEDGERRRRAKAMKTSRGMVTAKEVASARKDADDDEDAAGKLINKFNKLLDPDEPSKSH